MYVPVRTYVYVCTCNCGSYAYCEALRARAQLPVGSGREPDPRNRDSYSTQTCRHVTSAARSARAKELARAYTAGRPLRHCAKTHAHLEQQLCR